MLFPDIPVHPTCSRFLGEAPCSTLAHPRELSQPHVREGLGQVSVTPQVVPPARAQWNQKCRSMSGSHWRAPCRHCRLSWPQYMSPSRQSGTLASQLFLHVPKPCMEPLLWASTPLPLCHLLFPEKAWSEHDLGSHRVLTHHFLPYILNLENWLEGVGRRKGLEAVRRLARGTFQPGAHTLRTCISSFFPLITLNSQNSCLIRATV